MRTRALLVLALALSGTGCSLVKLSDDIAQAHCKNDGDCEVLNDRKANDFDACNLWQCSKSTSYCELSALDKDHDGFTPQVTMVGNDDLVCEASTAKQDCDDDNDKRYPGNKERCDDLDNDCDTRIDEGQLKGDAQAGPAFTNANADGAGDVSYAVDPTSGKIAIAYSINRSAPVAGVSFLDNNLPSGGNANVLVHMTSPADLYASSVGITAMGGGKFAVAFFDTSGTRRMVAGPIDTSGAPAFVASDDMMAKGLHCAASDGDCSKLTKDGTRKPAIAAAGDDVIVAFVRAPEDVMCHAKSEVVTGAPLLANLLKVGTDGFEEQTPKAVKLGDSGSREAPALLALPDLKTGESLGFLLAYVDVDGAIALQSLHVNGGTIENGGILGSLSNAKERYSGVRLALGPKTDRGQSVGVAFQVGCTADARVGFALLNVKYDAQKGPLVDIDLREQLVGGSPNEKDANLAYSKNRDSWFVAYRAPASGQAGAHDLRARVLDAKGMPEGDDPYTLIKGVAMGSNATQVFLTPGIAPTLQADGWFGVVAYTEGSGNVLSTVAVGGCAKQ